MRSLITLKALTYAPTGGIVAAPTTSLPEQPGGVRNWDYRYCWLRDATFTLNALLLAGYHEEAVAWREWLLRAVAGSPEDLQILYSVTGERRLDEYEVGWLPGYGGAAPVRVGNAASKQFQLDVYGEVMDTLHLARAAGLEPEPAAWRIQLALLKFLESNWQQPDEGIWEVRGPRRHFTHSKVMAWVAFDRAVKDVERFGLEGPVERWRQVRDAIHAQVCEMGFDAQRNTFVQSYGSPHLDASLLLIPQVGFLPPERSARARHGRRDRARTRRRRTGAALFDRNRCGRAAAGRRHVSALFILACRQSGIDRASRRRRGVVRALLALRNDLGLLSEEYDTREPAHAGKFSAGADAYGADQHRPFAIDSRAAGQNASEKGERPAAATETS